MTKEKERHFSFFLSGKTGGAKRRISRKRVTDFYSYIELSVVVLCFFQVFFSSVLQWWRWVLHIVATANCIQRVNSEWQSEASDLWSLTTPSRSLVFVFPPQGRMGEDNTWAVVHSSREYK